MRCRGFWPIYLCSKSMTNLLLLGLSAVGMSCFSLTALGINADFFHSPPKQYICGFSSSSSEFVLLNV